MRLVITIERLPCAEAGLIIVCFLCEDLFAGLWGIFLFHGAKVIILLAGQTLNIINMAF